MVEIGIVYFAQFADTVKIGFSLHPNRRLADLRGEAKVEGRFLARVALERREARFLERWLHRRFSDWRIHGEWFAAAPEILTFAEKLRGDPDLADREVAFGRHVRQVAHTRPAHENYRIISRVVRELIRKAEHPSEAALSELAKDECARLRLGYDGETIGRALRSELWKAGFQP